MKREASKTSNLPLEVRSCVCVSVAVGFIAVGYRSVSGFWLVLIYSRNHLRLVRLLLLLVLCTSPFCSVYAPTRVGLFSLSPFACLYDHSALLGRVICRVLDRLLLFTGFAWLFLHRRVIFSFVLYEQLERSIFMLDTSSDSDYWVIYTKI